MTAGGLLALIVLAGQASAGASVNDAAGPTSGEVIVDTLPGDQLLPPPSDQTEPGIVIRDSIADTGTSTGRKRGPDAAVETAADSVIESPPIEPMRTRRSNLILLGLAIVAIMLVLMRRWHVLRDHPLRPAAIAAILAFALFAGWWLSQQLGLAVLQILEVVPTKPPDAKPEIRSAGIIQIVTRLTALPFIISIVWKLAHPSSRSMLSDEDERDSEVPANRSSSLRAIGVGLLALLVSYPIVYAAGAAGHALHVLFTGEPPERIAHTFLAALVEAPRDGWWWVMIASVTLGAAVYEETIYRGLLQGTLSRNLSHRWLSIVIVSALFAIVHIGAVPWHAMPTLFVLSIGFGLVYERTGNLLAPIIMHLLFNIGNIVMAMTMAAAV